MTSTSAGLASNVTGAIGDALGKALPRRRAEASSAKRTERPPRLPQPVRHVISTVTRAITSAAGLIIFFSAASAIGVTSAWFAVQSGTPFNTVRDGPWVSWRYAADLDTEPYSRARFGSLATLLMTGDRIVRYEARTDSDGRRLHSSCVYEIASPPLAATWWSIGVFDARGALVSNPAERYGFSRATVARDGRGQFKLALARDAQPGNWLPTGAAGRMVIILEATEPETDETGQAEPFRLPPIRRVTC